MGLRLGEGSGRQTKGNEIGYRNAVGEHCVCARLRLHSSELVLCTVHEGTKIVWISRTVVRLVACVPRQMIKWGPL